MPGYDKSRFVCLNDSEEDEFTCGVCLAILKSPAVVPCCRQCYCLECISEWLCTQKSCPNDRQRLTVSQLYDPQRLVLNLLSRLRIRCLYQSHGCQTVSALQSVSTHEDNCQFNPDRQCIDCGLRMAQLNEGLAHNCVNSLKVVNTGLSQELVRLRAQVVRLEAQINSFIDNNGHNNRQYDHINQVIASARTRISSPEITYCSIPSAIRGKAINKSKEALLTFDSCSAISEYLDLQFNGQTERPNTTQWHISVHSIHCGHSLVRNQNGWIDLRFGALRIAIFSGGAIDSSVKTSSIMMN